MELEEYLREQIWDPKSSIIDVHDNKGCIDLIELKPFGILPSLDEECVVPQVSRHSSLQFMY